MGLLDWIYDPIANTVLGFVRTAWAALSTQGLYQAEYFCMGESNGLIWSVFTGNMMVCISHLVLPFMVLSQRWRVVVNTVLRRMMATLFLLTALEALSNAVDLWHGFYWYEVVIRNITGAQAIATLLLFIRTPYPEEEVDYASAS